MSDADLRFSSLREVERLLRARKVSSVELTEAALARLETEGPVLAATVTITRELALGQAREADRERAAGRSRGPLHGVPFGVKDLLATRGIPTTWGAEPYRGQMFDYDAAVVERLRAAGGVLTAKLAMVELAGGFGYTNPDASFTGPTRNPWNLEHWAGGSSSGPGAATAAGLVPFAIGSETSGSLLYPAAFCGLTGLRPTYGLVPRYGAMALSWSLDKLGPLARSAEDCSLVLEAIAGPDPRDASSTGSYRHRRPLAERRFRLAVPRNATAGAQPEVAEAFERSRKDLATFAELQEVDFPDLPWSAALGTILSSEAASNFEDLIATGGLSRLRATAHLAKGHAAAVTPAVDYLRAQRARGVMKNAMDRLLDGFDALVAPTVPFVAHPLGRDFIRPTTAAPAPTPPPGPVSPSAPATIPSGNLAGLPALCLPNGTGRNGLPTSLQFLGPAFSEAGLVALGMRYQAVTDWHTRRPPVAGAAR